MKELEEPIIYTDEYRGRKIEFMPTDDGSVIPKYKMFIDRSYVATCSLAEGKALSRELIDNLENRLFINRV